MSGARMGRARVLSAAALMATGMLLHFTVAARAAWSPSVGWVDVRLGDLNGDGKSDIAGFDPKTGQWWVELSSGSSFTTAQWGSWDPAATWVDVQVGDLNGDGKADLVGRRQDTGQWWAGISNGSAMATTQWDTWSPAVTWVHVRLGDLNGDGTPDIAGRDRNNGQWWAALSTGGNHFTTTMWGSPWSPTANWVDVRLGDLNGDGKADIVGRDSATGDVYVSLSTATGALDPSKWDTWSTGVSWVDVHVGDLDGDGLPDIAARVKETGQWWVSRSDGTKFTTTAWGSPWSPSVNWVDVQLGDFTGDGKADLAGRQQENGQWWVSRSTGTSFSTTMWDTWNPSISWVDVHIGDVNGDGPIDIAGRDQQSGQWWVAASTRSSFVTTDFDQPDAQVPEAPALPLLAFAGALGLGVSLLAMRGRRVLRGSNR